MAGSPILFLFAGPNGSGKSTLQAITARHFRPMSGVEFVNADEIAKKFGGEDSPERAEKARLAADARRAELLKSKISFCSETVFSHESKIELIEEAKRSGFKVYLFIVCVDSPELSELRVGQRVKRGGHQVPRDKIQQRYPRTLKNLEQGIAIADCSLVFDNSVARAFPRLLLAIEDRKLVYEDGPVPEWAKRLHEIARAAASGASNPVALDELVNAFKRKQR